MRDDETSVHTLLKLCSHPLSHSGRAITISIFFIRIRRWGDKITCPRVCTACYWLGLELGSEDSSSGGGASVLLLLSINLKRRQKPIALVGGSRRGILRASEGAILSPELHARCSQSCWDPRWRGKSPPRCCINCRSLLGSEWMLLTWLFFTVVKHALHRIYHFRSSYLGSVEMNLTRIHGIQVRTPASISGLRIQPWAMV